MADTIPHPALPLEGVRVVAACVYPSARVLTVRCPGPRARSARAGAQSHGDQLMLG